jgi:hypothetical protein
MSYLLNLTLVFNCLCSPLATQQLPLGHAQMQTLLRLPRSLSYLLFINMCSKIYIRLTDIKIQRSIFSSHVSAWPPLLPPTTRARRGRTRSTALKMKTSRCRHSFTLHFHILIYRKRRTLNSNHVMHICYFAGAGLDFIRNTKDIRLSGNRAVSVMHIIFLVQASPDQEQDFRNKIMETKGVYNNSKLCFLL